MAHWSAEVGEPRLLSVEVLSSYPTCCIPTPAGAGNTRHQCCGQARPGAHPRGCGEHAAPVLRPSASGGSSPRVRGTPLSGVFLTRQLRLIPAGAGNTTKPTARVDMSWAHPRGCGELVAALGTARLIPAGAGNTSGREPLELEDSAHPRGCGEHLQHEVRVWRRKGSSPRVRGTHLMTCSY